MFVEPVSSPQGSLCTSERWAVSLELTHALHAGLWVKVLVHLLALSLTWSCSPGNAGEKAHTTGMCHLSYLALPEWEIGAPGLSPTLPEREHILGLLLGGPRLPTRG